MNTPKKAGVNEIGYMRYLLFNELSGFERKRV